MVTPFQIARGTPVAPVDNKQQRLPPNTVAAVVMPCSRCKSNLFVVALIVKYAAHEIICAKCKKSAGRFAGVPR